MAHRIIELELNSNETIQLNLDEITNPPSNDLDGEAVMMLLQEAKPQAWWKWTAIATEFARKGLRPEAEDIAREAVRGAVGLSSTLVTLTTSVIYAT
jgi:hypothetical protein